jgi:transposase
MRRTHLRGHRNILKRLLVHVSGYNLGLLMRTMFGIGTPRGLQGRVAAAIAALGVSARRWSAIVEETRIAVRGYFGGSRKLGPDFENDSVAARYNA